MWPRTRVLRQATPLLVARFRVRVLAPWSTLDCVCPAQRRPGLLRKVIRSTNLVNSRAGFPAEAERPPVSPPLTLDLPPIDVRKRHRRPPRFTQPRLTCRQMPCQRQRQPRARRSCPPPLLPRGVRQLPFRVLRGDEHFCDQVQLEQVWTDRERRSVTHLSSSCSPRTQLNSPCRHQPQPVARRRVPAQSRLCETRGSARR